MGKETAEDQGRTPGRRKEYEIGRTRSGLRLGFTTGSCAAAAAKAGVQMLLSGDEVRQVRLMTPKGIELYLDVEEIRRGPGSVPRRGSSCISTWRRSAGVPDLCAAG